MTVDNNDGVKPVLRNFGETTSVKGVGRALKSPRPFMRAVWIIAVLFGLSFALYNILTLLVQYFQHKTVVDMDWCNGDCDVPFPDVTVCNINPLSLSLDEYDWDEDDPPWDFLQYQKLVTSIFTLDDMHRQMEYYLNQTISADTWEQLYGTYASMPTYFQNFQLDDAERLRDSLQRRFLQYCSFFDWDLNMYKQSTNCSLAQVVTAVLSPQYLWCFTLQTPPGNRVRTRGMQTILYLDNFGYSNMALFEPHLLRSQATGVKVVIHPRGTLPDMSTGFFAGPGQQTDVILSAANTERLGQPYGECEQGDDGLRAMDTFPGDPNINYTYRSCQSGCVQNDIMNRCGCKAGHLALTESMWKETAGMPFCQKVNISVSSEGITLEDLANFQPVIAKSIQQTLCEQEQQAELPPCPCHKLCEEMSYSYQQHAIPWPHKGYERAFYDNFIRENSDINMHFSIYEDIAKLLNSKVDSENFTLGRDMLQKSTLITDNFLQLNMYFEDESLLQQLQQPAITKEALFGSIGGNFNLWIGITFFTLIELVELCYDFALLFCKREFHQKTCVMHIDSANTDEKQAKWATSVTHGQKS